jgi:hypothetical protein
MSPFLSTGYANVFNKLYEKIIEKLNKFHIKTISDAKSAKYIKLAVVPAFNDINFAEMQRCTR